jgi:hypothetical protein
MTGAAFGADFCASIVSLSPSRDTVNSWMAYLFIATDARLDRTVASLLLIFSAGGGAPVPRPFNYGLTTSQSFHNVDLLSVLPGGAYVQEGLGYTTCA